MAGQCSTFSKLFLPVLRKAWPITQSVTGKSVEIRRQCLRTLSTKLHKQEVVNDINQIKIEESADVFAKLNEQIVNKSYGRLFAVVYIGAYQYKVTTEDILVIRDYWAPTAGDKIRLEKVLLVGSSDFTLIGRPLLPHDQVTVLATVIEKTHTHPIPIFKYRPRSNYMKLTFQKNELTYLRITDITINEKVNQLGDTDGFKDRVF
ncbi:hypothetical protein RUM44_002238 [Polyplax serrata]|uniref:Large ribosomal subunit protein bL21m n=1 Tax=Polyplax serrata TaxID=468196 RepID=A0ABR1AMA6_POLSC